jgi:CHAD domain-containing protein
MKSVLNILQQQFGRIQIEEIRFFNDPNDPERAHDLRVSIRTLRGLCKFLKHQIPPASFTIIDQDLSAAAQIFGQLREMDVLIEKISQYAYEHPVENPSYQHLFATFYQQRQQQMEISLKPTTRQQLDENLLKVKKQLDQLHFETTADWQKLITREMKQRQKKINKAFLQLDLTDYPQVHRIRKRAKTLRYSATFFAGFITKTAQKAQLQAEKIQNECGIITDAHVNFNLLSEFVQKFSDKNDQQLLLKIAQEQQKLYLPKA